MNPIIISAIATAQHQDKLVRAAQARQARTAARQARMARTARQLRRGTRARTLHSDEFSLNQTPCQL
ncbi:MAG: hypothetical protein ACRDNZ_24190 [Streptosporangiaceae bacterium]